MHKKIGIALFFVILIGLPVMTFTHLPKDKKPFSENENRYLEEYPEVSLETIKSEDFMNGFDKWFSDRFYGRENWISTKNKVETALGKSEISTVYTKDDQMMQLISTNSDIGTGCDYKDLDKNVNVINTFAEENPDIPVYFMLCPTSVGIYGEDLLPDYLKNVTEDEQDVIDYCYNKLDNVTGINIIDALKASKDQYIYYRTDHHWTSLGAYIAYNAAGDQLGYTPYSIDDFTKTVGSESFQGTLFSKTLDQSVKKDEIDMYTLADGSISTTMEISNGVTTTEHDGIFYKEYLDVKDKYSTFTGQNAACVTFKNKGVSNGKSLLIIKDSYANSLIQFMSCNYETITMLDMRYTNLSYSDLVNVADYDQAVFIYNCITFAEDTNLAKLNLK